MKDDASPSRQTKESVRQKGAASFATNNAHGTSDLTADNSTNIPSDFRRKAKVGTLPKAKVSNADGDHDCFHFYIEELPHLLSYQLDLRAKSHVDTKAMELEQWSIQISHASEEASTVSIYNAFCEQHLFFQIPGRVKEAVDRVSVSNERLSIRLGVERLEEPLIKPSSTSLKVANDLACSGCGSILPCNPAAENSPRIQRVLPLPSGLWEDMSDYLVCFEGQPSIDFTSSSTGAQRGRVLEDDTVLVYHFDDVAPNLQVLAIPAYGEGEKDDQPTMVSSRALPLVRGSRTWSDAVGGATITCSCCCLVLGVAPMELLDTARLYKHRVMDSNQMRLASILNFCVHSMIRHAESKALFSCLVRDEANTRSAFVLQLVGWEGKAAVQFRHDGDGELAWSRLAKVLYEERHDIAPEDSTGDIFLWTQGDWCCPPNETDPTAVIREEKKTERVADLPASSVSLWLEPDEWKRLNEELQLASQMYAKEIVSATFLAKNGRLPNKSATSGLAAVFLQ